MASKKQVRLSNEYKEDIREVAVKLATLLGAVILAGTGIVAAMPAQADLDHCQDAETCIWEHNGYQGNREDKAHGQGTIVAVPAVLNNRMDSWANRSAVYGSCGWNNSNGTGDAQEWDATRNDNDVSDVNADEVSSWRTRYGCN